MDCVICNVIGARQGRNMQESTMALQDKIREIVYPYNNEEGEMRVV